MLKHCCKWLYLSVHCIQYVYTLYTYMLYIIHYFHSLLLLIIRITKIACVPPKPSLEYSVYHWSVKYFSKHNDQNVHHCQIIKIISYSQTACLESGSGTIWQQMRLHQQSTIIVCQDTINTDVALSKPMFGLSVSNRLATPWNILWK